MNHGDHVRAASVVAETIAAGAESEAVLSRQRAMGLNQISCVKVLRQFLGISLGDAKVAVHYSQAWADRRESNDALHEAAFAAAGHIGSVKGSAGENL